MVEVTIKEQYPGDIGDGSLRMVYAPDAEDVVLISQQFPSPNYSDRSKKKIYLIVNKEEFRRLTTEFLAALNVEEN